MYLVFGEIWAFLWNKWRTAHVREVVIFFQYLVDKYTGNLYTKASQVKIQKDISDIVSWVSIVL